VSRDLVIGAGSIGLRHAEVLAGEGDEVALLTARTDLDLATFTDLERALTEFDPSYVVIANQTSLHAASLGELARLGYRGAVLVEKPLALPDPTAALPFERVGVGFNLRFHPVIVRLLDVLGGLRVLTVEAYAGQHLASWRPDRPTASQYSALKASGGGVLRDLSHELDYLGALLGDCLGVFARGGRIGTVTEDSDDAWGIVAGYERAPIVTLQLNYLDTHTRRRLVINTSDGTIEADVIAGTLRIGDEIERFEVARNDTYRALHRAMRRSDSAVTSLAEAAATDRIIGMIESSAREQRWIAS
jgi:predicted dehydrogenase